METQKHDLSLARQLKHIIEIEDYLSLQVGNIESIDLKE